MAAVIDELFKERRWRNCINTVMTQPALIWELTIVLIVALLLFDYFFHIRKAHIPTLKEAATWSAVYIGIALLFGAAVFVLGGTDMGTEYFAGYVTEKALSIDNVFVFLLIMSAFKVPRADQQKALLIGIVFSLIARTGFIFLGAALIESFSWVFYLFGLILLMASGHMLMPQEKRGAVDQDGNLAVRLTRALVPTTGFYDGDKLFTVHEGQRQMTPMVLVIVALGATDIMFALDSIPAIFGLTQNVFVVFTATAFSLLGLRQLYFLIDVLLERLLYLSYGLAAILGFIGTKLILHALHENTLPFINDGTPVRVIEISTRLSLIVIIAILVFTVLMSLLSPKGKAKTVVTALRQHVAEYLDPESESDPAARDEAFAKLSASAQQVSQLKPELKKLIREPDKLQALVDRARQQHASGGTGE
jgi:tellurite resistance protein TerC